MQLLPLSKIRPAKYQLRERMDGLEELKASIQQKGLIEPILVRPVNDHFEVVAGSRRYIAVIELKWTEVQATVRTLSDKEAFEIALMENIQRRSMDPVEEAKAYKRYCIDNGWGSQTELAMRLGLSQGLISDRLKILKLGEENLHMVKIGEISVSHAESIASLDTAQMNEMTNQVVKMGMDVNKTRVAVAAVKAGYHVDQAVEHAMNFPDVPVLFKEKIDEKINIRDHCVLGWSKLIDTLQFWIGCLPDGPEKQWWTTTSLFLARQGENEAMAAQKRFNNGKAK